MATVSRVVDISADAVTTRQRRRHRLLRLGVPILGVALVIAAILGITFYSHAANRQGVLALSDQLLESMDAQIANQVAFFLAPGERALRIMRDMAKATAPGDRPAVTEHYAVSVLKEVPQVAAFYVGNSDGDFAMVRRQRGGVSVKEIFNVPGHRHVILSERDSSGKEISQREDPTDTYDPRHGTTVP